MWLRFTPMQIPVGTVVNVSTLHPLSSSSSPSSTLLDQCCHEHCNQIAHYVPSKCNFLRLLFCHIEKCCKPLVALLIFIRIFVFLSSIHRTTKITNCYTQIHDRKSPMWKCRNRWIPPDEKRWSSSHVGLVCWFSLRLFSLIMLTAYWSDKNVYMASAKDWRRKNKQTKRTQQIANNRSKLELFAKFIDHLNINKYNYCHSYLVNVLDARKRSMADFAHCTLPYVAQSGASVYCFMATTRTFLQCDGKITEAIKIRIVPHWCECERGREWEMCASDYTFDSQCVLLGLSSFSVWWNRLILVIWTVGRSIRLSSFPKCHLMIVKYIN